MGSVGVELCVEGSLGVRSYFTYSMTRKATGALPSLCNLALSIQDLHISFETAAIDSLGHKRKLYCPSYYLWKILLFIDNTRPLLSTSLLNVDIQRFMLE